MAHYYGIRNVTIKLVYDRHKKSVFDIYPISKYLRCIIYLIRKMLSTFLGESWRITIYNSYNKFESISTITLSTNPAREKEFYKVKYVSGFP